MSAAPTREVILDVRDIRVEVGSGRPVIADVSLSLGRGEVIGIVGESGSGKTTAAYALLGYARPGMRITGGTVTVGGQTIDLRDEHLARSMRGRLVSHVPQDPATSLNPSRRIAPFIDDVMRAHRPQDASDAAVHEALARVGLPADSEFGRRFPHQLSGGQQQRVLIASALVCGSPLIVLDEPTTGLDVVTQARVLGEIERLHEERGLAMVYVSHDLAVVSQVADRVAVMYAGRFVEEGPTATVLTRPRHPYTRALLDAIPDHLLRRPVRGIPGIAVGIDDRPRGCAFAPRCTQKVEQCEVELPAMQDFAADHAVRCIRAHQTPPLQQSDSIAARHRTGEPVLEVEHLTALHKTRDGAVIAASDISFTVDRASCLALVGESGSGKTTIARAVAGLHPPASGTIRLQGEELAPHARQRSRQARRRCQLIFQNPYDSLHPKQRVGDLIARPARMLRDMSRSEAEAETKRLLDQVRLPARYASKFPTELSGGERQRVAIARALAAGPELLVCDEITSALDVSVQAAVIALLNDLRESLGLALLFITHNLGVVAAIADEVMILDKGEICERGDVESVFGAPQHPRTQELLSSAPTLAHFAAV